MRVLTYFCTIVPFISLSHAVPSPINHYDTLYEKVKRDANPTVSTDYGTWVGTSNSGVESFKGIPYAQPPLGELRFTAPRPPNVSYGIFSAQDWGPSCAQMGSSLPQSMNDLSHLLGSALKVIEKLPILEDLILDEMEDCLNLNVWRPAGVKGPLPVLFWIYGGAFTSGSTRLYDGSVIVQKSIEIGKPIIFVSPNYRLNGFGFLPGRQVKPGGGDINAGLLDQRLAMKWVQKYISLFGGNPDKVTIFGESAGAMSVGFHLIANNGDNEGLFQGAIMQSGSPTPSLGAEGGQASYDQIVTASGCNKTSDSFKCLQQLPFDVLKNSINTLPGLASYNGLHLPFLPRVDGNFISSSSFQLLQEGKYANVPIITGNCFDEGTVLTIGSLNVTNTDGVRAYLRTIFPALQESRIDKLLELYPEEPEDGSPFDTNGFNDISGQNKRIAALGGDIVMQAPRRFVLDTVRKTQPIWSYESRALMLTPVLGSFHGSDLVFLFNFLPINPRLTNELQSRWINFANDFNPNPDGLIDWPMYGDNKLLLQFGDFVTTVEGDTFREDEMNYILSDTSPFAI